MCFSSCLLPPYRTMHTQVLEIVAMVACLVVIIAGAYYGKKTVDKLKAEEDSKRVEQELKAMGLGEEGLLELEREGHHGHHHHHHHHHGHHHGGHHHDHHAHRPKAAETEGAGSEADVHGA